MISKLTIKGMGTHHLWLARTIECGCCRAQQSIEKGKIINLMSADVENIIQFVHPALGGLVVLPLTIIAAIVQLYMQISCALPQPFHGHMSHITVICRTALSLFFRLCHQVARALSLLCSTSVVAPAKLASSIPPTRCSHSVCVQIFSKRLSRICIAVHVYATLAIA